MVILKYAEAGRDPNFYLADDSQASLVLIHEDHQTKTYAYGIYEVTYSGSFSSKARI